MQRPTLEDVARAAGVSRATVSRVVRQDTGVSSTTVARVQQAVAELGYVPNSAARVLASGTTNTIALVVPEPDERVFSDPFFGLAVSGISAGLEPTGMQLVMAFAPTTGRPTATIQFLLAGGVAGVIVMSHHRSDGLARAVVDLPLPSVFLGAPLAVDTERVQMHTVDTDNFRGGQLAGAHLVSLGVARPATITGPLDMNASTDRLDGFRRSIAAAGLEAMVAEGDFSQESGQLCAAQLLDAADVDALFVASDHMAEGALRELHARGLRPGEDVKVVGFDDFSVAKSLGLTTIANPAVQLGREAAQMVTELIDHGTTRSPRILPVTLNIRDTA
ncbi:MAG: LacI family transcriptional regulator [Propionibacterium sp.]|nr:LacI family transcriptional regulator [Propionibacterium sp.]